MGATQIRKTDITIVDHTLDIDTDGNFKLAGTAVTATADELNKLDDCLCTTAELNKMNSCTATTEELNVLTGMVSDVAFTTTSRYEASNAMAIYLTMKDADGTVITGQRTSLLAYLAQDAYGKPSTGQSYIAVDSTGSSAGDDIGAVQRLVQYRSYRVVSTTDGVLMLRVSKDGNNTSTAVYVCVALPHGKVDISHKMVFV